MGNKCSCAEISNDKLKILNSEDDITLNDFDLDLKQLETQLYENDEENYFYRFQNKNIIMNLDIKNEEEKKRNGNNERKCTINVKRILMYIKEHEKDFLTFFKEINVTSLIFLKYLIMNYTAHIIYIDTDVIYIGEVSEKNEKNGLGIIITPDQCIYIGEFEKDKITGFGLYVHFSRSKYIGYWKNGKANNYGVFIHPDGTFYKGFWLNDKQNKKGIEYVNNNYVFLGNYAEGEKNGFGAFIWNNESMYIGNIKNNSFFKRGIYFFNRSKIYIGKWRYNCIQGECEIFWLDNRQFVGFHNNNLKEGLGIYKWNDGRIYFGNWLNNKQHGHGIFILIKHLKDYEKYINNSFLLFFKNTQKIKKEFLLNLSKESFFDKGKVKDLLERITKKCNNYDFYNFLIILLNINYYKMCSKYFNLLKKKKLNNFKFNYKFYEKIKFYLCSTTNDYLNKQNLNESIKSIKKYSSNKKDLSLHSDNEKKLYINNNKIEDINNNSKITNKIEKDEKKKINKIDKEENNKYISLDSNNDHIKNKNYKKYSVNNNDMNKYNFSSSDNNEEVSLENNKEKYFEDIELLLTYLNSINLNDMNESDINLFNPIFTYGSNNIILKYGKWKNGKLKKWIYSSGNSKYRTRSISNKTNNNPNLSIEKKNTTELFYDNNYNVINKFLNNLSSSAISDIYKQKKKKKKKHYLMKSNSKEENYDADIEQDKKEQKKKKKSSNKENEDDEKEKDEDEEVEEEEEEVYSKEKLKKEQSEGDMDDEEEKISEEEYEKELQKNHSSYISTGNIDNKISLHEKALIQHNRNTLSDKSDYEKKNKKALKKLNNSNSNNTNSTISTKNNSSSFLSKNMSSINLSFTESNKEKINYNENKTHCNTKGENSNNNHDLFYENTITKNSKNLDSKNFTSALSNESKICNKEEKNYIVKSIYSIKNKVTIESKSLEEEKEKGNIIAKERIKLLKEEEINESSSYEDDKIINEKEPKKHKKKRENKVAPIKSKNYDLPKKGFSLIWNMKKLKNAPFSTNENIIFESDKNRNVEQNNPLVKSQQKKKSFFRKFLKANKYKKKNKAIEY
ncbi:phosphatidylinositol-4-phosphate 5-kinase, putative [Plasmodium relictum]|uniref:Phosphatidylinositol-4-phosphate 5-kinase, putative n=1 Tax=Plasmodium relictum TaxID=85471 RepID=A0A1J1H5I1_PLARL|nr:phosphatidylinositol-4-phosphate 5-kinase, putative [Plasmodium relictum]CRH00167.1 phosphatidylinositol-4-phosphate 5-kinase, putative [Plasmodium relictum]